MCCQPTGLQRSIAAWGGGWGCGCWPVPRRFISEKEEQEMLQKYRDQLKMELDGVEERIQELKSR